MASGAGYAAVARVTGATGAFKKPPGFGRYLSKMPSNCDAHDWVEHRFPAMGSQAHLVLRGTPQDARWAQHEIERLEYRWSRFYGCSDVARGNRAAGRAEVAGCTEPLVLLDAASAWWRATDGWFDPTVRHALEGEPPDGPAPGCAGIVVDHATNSIFLPDGVGIDLGGIGKGAAADRVVAGLAARGVVAACVSLGGDVRAFGDGHSASGHGWGVPVLSPPSDGAHVMCTREIHDGAIVTSTTGPRRWRHRGRREHHLIDPTTGRAADTGLAAVVVADRSTARAEVLAKAAFVAGRERGEDLLARFGVDGWFIPHDTAA
jgi:thiamine biosynthesis lipoprotein